MNLFKFPASDPGWWEKEPSTKAGKLWQNLGDWAWIISHPKLENLDGLFWALPQWIKDAAQPKGKKDLKIIAFKEGGKWMFNKLPITWHEELCFGGALDEISKGSNKISISISLEEQEGWEIMHFIDHDFWSPGASFWHWKQHDIWLCGWLPWFFGFIPEKMWFKAEPIKGT